MASEQNDSTVNKRNAQGFSLIEIMVTLAVAGVFVSVGVPSFQNYIDEQRAVTQANDLIMAFNYARSEAIKQARHVTVCKSDNGATCTNRDGWEGGWITFANNSLADAANVDAGEFILRRHASLSGDLTLRSPDVAPDFVAYRPTGEASVSGTFILCDDRGVDSARAVVINAAGRPRISDEQLDGSDLVCPAGE